MKTLKKYVYILHHSNTAVTTQASLFPHETNATITEPYLSYPVAYNRLTPLYSKSVESHYMF